MDSIKQTQSSRRRFIISAIGAVPAAVVAMPLKTPARRLSAEDFQSALSCHQGLLDHALILGLRRPFGDVENSVRECQTGLQNLHANLPALLTRIKQQNVPDELKRVAEYTQTSLTELSTALKDLNASLEACRTLTIDEPVNEQTIKDLVTRAFKLSLLTDQTMASLLGLRSMCEAHNVSGAEFEQFVHGKLSVWLDLDRLRFNTTTLRQHHFECEQSLAPARALVAEPSATTTGTTLEETLTTACATLLRKSDTAEVKEGLEAVRATLLNLAAGPEELLMASLEPGFDDLREHVQGVLRATGIKFVSIQLDLLTIAARGAKGMGGKAGQNVVALSVLWLLPRFRFSPRTFEYASTLAQRILA